MNLKEEKDRNRNTRESISSFLGRVCCTTLTHSELPDFATVDDAISIFRRIANELVATRQA